MRSVPSGCTIIPSGSFFAIFCASAQPFGSVTTNDAPPVTCTLRISMPYIHPH